MVLSLISNSPIENSNLRKRYIHEKYFRYIRINRFNQMRDLLIWDKFKRDFWEINYKWFYLFLQKSHLLLKVTTNKLKGWNNIEFIKLFKYQKIVKPFRIVLYL